MFLGIQEGFQMKMTILEEFAQVGGKGEQVVQKKRNTLQWFFLLQSTASRAEAQELQHSRWSEAQGIFLDQGLNLCLLHQQADSLPLSHQGNPGYLSIHFFPSNKS